MSKFKFRLATLLRLHEATRDERRGALAEAYRVDDVLQNRMERTRDELRRVQSQCRSAVAPGEVDVDRLVEAQRYEMTLRAEQAQLGRQRKTVAEEIERRRQALLEADREVRVLEKLRDKQAEHHRLEDQRREAKRLDEVAQQQAMREVVR
jgi:flagellar protein FliJ